MPSAQSVSFVIVEGQISYEGKYYQRLLGGRGQKFSPRLAMPGKQNSHDIRPSNLGCISDRPLLTVHEAYGALHMRCLLQYEGNQFEVDLSSVIEGFVGIMWTNDCDHNINDCLKVSKVGGYNAVSTSVIGPTAQGALGIAMTRGDPTSQFFCCDLWFEDHNSKILESIKMQDLRQFVLQKNCCLNCAAKMVAHKQTGVIICG